MAKPLPLLLMTWMVTAGLCAQAPAPGPETLLPPGSCHGQGLPPMGGAMGGPRKGQMPGGAGLASLRFLDLTPAQAKAAREVLDKHKPAMVERHKSLMAREAALRDALEDPAATEPQLRTLATVAGAARLQEVLEERAVFVDLQALLTPAQQARAGRLRKKMQTERLAHEDVMEELGEPRPAFAPCPGL